MPTVAFWIFARNEYMYLFVDLVIYFKYSYNKNKIGVSGGLNPLFFLIGEEVFCPAIRNL